MTVSGKLREFVLPNVRNLLASQRASELVSRAFHGDIPSRGLRFRVDDAAVGSKTAAELFFRLYERHELAFIRHQMLVQCDVLELGAGIGVTGGNILRRLDGNRRFIAVEANEALLPVLRGNLDRNGGNHDIAVLHGAVSYAGSDTATLRRSAEHVHSRVSDSSSLTDPTVPAFTLGGLVKRLGLTNYVLVSDIEGTERDIIADDAAALAGCRQLIIELHGSASQVAQMSESLARLGFVPSARRKTIYAFTRQPAQPVSRNVGPPAP